MATDDVAIKELTREVQALSRALAEMHGKAKGAADATKALGDKAEEAGEDSRRATGAIDLGWRQLATGGIAAATAALGAWVAQVPEGAARAEAHQRALTQLGGAYDAVRSATNGAVSAEQAAQVQQRALQSGVRLTAQELAAVTARAREYARATGTELGQALDQLTDQLVDPGEELRKFGVFLQTGMSAGDALRETLRQLGAQAGSTAPAVMSLAEAQEDLHRATQEASDALSSTIAQELGLRDFYVSLASWIRDATTQMGALDAAADAVVGTFREMMHGWGIVSQTSAQFNQSRSGGFMQEAGSLATQLRERGLNLGGVDLAQLALHGSEDQQRTALDLMRRRLGRAGNVRTGGLPAALQGGRGFGVGGSAAGLPALVGGVPDAVDEIGALRSLVGTITERAARDAEMRTMTEGKRRQSAALERELELGRRNTASTSAGSQSDRRTRLQRLMDEALGGGASDWVHHNRSLRSDLPFEGSASGWRPGIPGEQDPETMLSLIRQGQEKAKRDLMGLDIAGRQESLELWRRGAEAGASRDSSGRIGSDDRVRILSEQREALRALTEEATRAEQVAREQHRSQSDVNDLMRQRIGLQQALVQTTQELTEATREQTAWLDPWTESMRGAGETIAGGFADALFDAVDGTKAFVDSMDELLRATLRTIAKQAVVEALKSTATGLYNLATGNVPGSIAAFKAAAVWGGTAVAAGVASAAAPPTSGAQGAARVDGGERSTAARADRDRGAGGPLVLNVTVSGAAFTDAGVHQAVASALRGATSSGYLTPTDLRGLLDG